MRLTCPNCGAQYEVPDEVIPKDGRDVQCSNCGNTWFQGHGEPPEDADTAAPAVSQDTEHEDAAPYESEPDDMPEPEAEPERRPPEPDAGNVDPAVSNILRQEAERESQLRASELGESLESQPDLGLDDLPDDETSRRSREARNRMARIRGETPQEAGQGTEADSRRGLLPDIEEINSSLRASDDGADPNTAVGPVRVVKAARKGNFKRGFSVAILLAVALILIYMNADRIGQSVPKAVPVLDAYVTVVDQARLWLDTKVSEWTNR